MKLDAWKMKFPFRMVPFQETFVHFFGGYFLMNQGVIKWDNFFLGGKLDAKFFIDDFARDFFVWKK